MAKYTQANRLLAVTTPLGTDALLLERFTGTEAISELYHFQLDLLAEGGTAVPFDKLLGQKISVELRPPRGVRRFFHGIISKLSQGPQVRSAEGDTTFIRYRIEMVPHFWLWTKNVQSRIFQHVSVLDILKEVLAGLKPDLAFELTGAYQPRNYCVQYRESDFAFASRLMEEEGIYYYFKHTADSCQMVVANSPITHPDLPEPNKIIYEEVEGGFREETRIGAWEKTQEVCSGKVALWDHQFQLAQQSRMDHLQAEQPIADSIRVGTVSHRLRLDVTQGLELYYYPGGYAHRFDGIDKGGADQAGELRKIFEDNLRTAKVRIEQEAATAVLINGASNCGHLLPGHKFTLDRHFDANGPYLLTRVEHSASIAGTYASGAAVEPAYQNQFACAPAALPHRPRRNTPRPRIDGTQTATVVGPAGEEIFVDKYGRVKVQFHWDRQGKWNADSSCWVRVGQVWAGKRWGAFFWPRIGQEVIVAFEDGNPDEPIIIGSVYNAENMPPFELPANVMVGGIKSTSVTGDPASNFNGVVFYDKLGEEYLQLHGERHVVFNDESSKSVHVGQRHLKVVGTLPFVGSGSGSGSGGGEEGSPFNWPGTEVFGSLAHDLSLVVGEHIETFLGVTGDYVIGDHIEMVINPIGFLGQFGGEEGGAALKGIAGAFGGAIVFAIGAETRLLYGPEISIHHGAKVELTAHMGPTIILAGLTGAVALASGIVASLAHDDEAEERLAQFGITGVAGIMLSILTGIECQMGIAEAALNKSQEALNLTTKIETAAFKFASNISGAAERRVNDALGLVGQAAQAATAQAAAAQQEAIRAVKTFGGPYSINASDISFLARAVPALGGPADAAAMGAASTIALSALGGGEAAGNGFIILNSTGGTLMASGTAGLGVRRVGPVGQVLGDAGPTGTVLFSQGLPDEGSRMTLAPLGVAQAFGPPGQGASITMTALGIKLQFGEWYIAITAEGITLSVGENTFTMTPVGVRMAGLNVDVQGDAHLGLEAPVINQNADGEDQRNAGVLMIV